MPAAKMVKKKTTKRSKAFVKEDEDEDELFSPTINGAMKGKVFEALIGYLYEFPHHVEVNVISSFSWVTQTTTKPKHTLHSVNSQQ